MAEMDKLDQLVDFKPFYDQQTTTRLLEAYLQKPHLFKPQSVSELKDHASWYGIQFQEPQAPSPKDSQFDPIRAVRQLGEGFFSGFTTFNVGEPSANPYERIIRSVGQLGGFVGYLPTLPGKLLKSTALIEMAKSLRGNSVPMWVAKKATEAARPIVGKTLTKVASAKQGAMKDAAEFLTGDVAKHVTEGAFHLGIASGVGAWQQGVLEALKAGMHGAVTGGAFRGIANIVNKGGIPKLDQETGKYILNTAQKEDQIIRSAASSLYEGLQSSMRGETTPEQIYSYLLGAFFGAHETTAGQMRAMRFVQDVEKQAESVSGKELKRLDPKTGKPYVWDTVVYDPRLKEGWGDLPKDVQESVMHTMLMRHGTYGKQAMMASKTLQGAMIEKIFDTDQSIKISEDLVRKQQIEDKKQEIIEKQEGETKVEIRDQEVLDSDIAKEDDATFIRDVDPEAPKPNLYVGDAEIVYKKIDKKRGPEDMVPARTIYGKDGVNKVEIDRDLLRKKYDEKAWTKPKVKGVTPLPENAFRNYKEWEVFVLGHEQGHALEGPGPKRGTPEYAANENKLNVNLKDVDPEAPKPEGPKNVIDLDLSNMSDENIVQNKGIIRKALSNIKTDRIVIPENLVDNLEARAPETYDYLMDKIGDIVDPTLRAQKILEETGKIHNRSEIPEDTDIGNIPDVVLDRDARRFVNTHLKDLFTSEKVSIEEKPKKVSESINIVTTLLDKYSKRKGKSVRDEKFIADIEKAFKKQGLGAFGPEAKKDLRSMLFRKSNSVDVPQLTLSLSWNLRDRRLMPVTKDSPFNLAGNDKHIMDSPKLIERIYKDLGGDGRAYAVLDHVTIERGKGNNTRHVEIEMSKIYDQNSWTGKARWDKTLAKEQGDKVVEAAIVEAHKKGFLYAGGKGDTGKLYFLKPHKDLNPKRLKFDAESAAKELDAKNGYKDYIAERDAFYSKNKGVSKDYFDKTFLNNLLWEKELYAVKNPMDLDTGKSITFYQWLSKYSSIKDAKGFNKRNQIWMTDGFDVDQIYFKNNYKEKGLKLNSLHRGLVNFRLIEDAPKGAKGLNELAEKYVEATDGMIVVEENFLDSLNDSYGHPDSGQNKAFIAGRDPERKHGALLGKFMFHKASPEASAHMRESKVHMYVYESSAKEFGTRNFGDLKVDENLNATYKGDTYQMKLSDIKGSLSEKQTSHMMEAQQIPKQMMSNLFRHSKSPIEVKVIEDFFAETIGKHAAGQTQWNDLLRTTLDKEPGELTQLEKDTILKNIDKMGLSEVIDAVKNPNHPELVQKIYEAILKKNMDDVVMDYQSGEISGADYREALADAKTVQTGINRMMEAWPSKEVFLHKDVRNYMQAAMKSFVVNRVIRPKWDTSMSVRMRGLDPWLIQKDGLKDLNSNDSAYLKKKYGVENADELVFLDDRFRKTEWDISHIITGKKKRTLEEIWELSKGKYKDNAELQDFFNTISLRVPMDSISGAHQLKFAGFTGVDGHGAIFHPRTMRALGGADLDGDKAFVMFGMKPEWRDMYHKNKREFVDDNNQIRGEKEDYIPKEGLDILMDTLDPTDPHNARVLSLAKQGKVSYQDLLTTTKDGSAEDLRLKGSIINKYTPSGRLNISRDAAMGRNQLGPAVNSRSILNSTYEAMLHKDIEFYKDKKGKRFHVDKLSEAEKKKLTPDLSERHTFEIYDEASRTSEEYTIFIEPRKSEKDLQYSRELAKAQIAFGSDPLDEIGLTGTDAYFDSAWHSLFKIDWAGKKPPAGYSPNRHARQGLFNIFADFNRAYFGKNWRENRRYHQHEIIEMGSGIESLNAEQQKTMLPQMIKRLHGLDYADDLLNHVDLNLLKKRYDDYTPIANQMEAAYGKALKRVSFKVPINRRITHVIDQNLISGSERFQAYDNINRFKEIFNNKFIKGLNSDRKKRGLSKALGVNSYGSKLFWEAADPATNWAQFIDKKTGLLQTRKFYKAIHDARDFRMRMINKLYREASDFLINDSMDRTSARQLSRALDMNKNIDPAFLEKMVDNVSNIKDTERNLRAEALRQELVEGLDNSKLKNKEEAARLINDTFSFVKQGDKSFMIQHQIDARIRDFKYNNAHKKVQRGNDNGKLTDVEAYLYDTLMLSSFDKGKELRNMESYKKLPKDVKAFMRPYIRKLQDGNSGTTFRKTAFNTKYTDQAPLRDFLKEYSKEFEDMSITKADPISIEQIEGPKYEKKVEPEIPKIPFEPDHAGLRPLRDKSVADLNKVETAMVDELVGHLKHYSTSLPEGAISLNKITRGLFRKNFDAMSIENYRVLNNFFRQMRSGNMFIKPGKLTKDGIVKLSERHHMLFPKTISEEMMMKDFQIFEEEGVFQNYNGEWKRGMVGRPTQAIEHIQYALGATQDASVKKDEDEKNALHTKLKHRTGYEGLPDGIGYAIMDVTSAMRDLRAVENLRIDPQERAFKVNIAKKNLEAAKEKAKWNDTKGKKFQVVLEKGIDTRTGEQILESIDQVLTERAIEAAKWIKGGNWKWDNGVWAREGENPLERFILKKKGKVQYWDENKESPTIPRIDIKKFTEHLFALMKKGKTLDMNFGQDNLRLVQHSMKIDALEKLRLAESDPMKVKEYSSLIKAFKERHTPRPTDLYSPDAYHPHFIQNKTVAKESMIKAIEKIQKGPLEQALKEKEIGKIITKYRSMSGDWLINDIVEQNLLDGALREIAEKKKGEHLKHYDSNPRSGNTQRRTGNIEGWATDIGAWENYQKSLIDTHFRQVGQILSRQMLNQFHDFAKKTWKDEGQVKAWYNFINDYISRSLGHPSIIPDSWMEGPDAQLMKVKGTPYSWFADNHVKDVINKAKKKFGIKEDTRLPEELRGIDEMDLRHWSNLEAKYQMATLLAHPKSAVANIFGGTLHTIQSVGWRTWKDSRNVEYIKSVIGDKEVSKWTSKKDLDKWVIGHGVIPDFIMYETGLNPMLKGTKWKGFLDDAKKLLDKDPMVKDDTLLTLAKKHKITEGLFHKAAWFMREPERMLRRDAFISHYLHARELFGHQNMELNHPLLIEMAKKGVKATQFLYSAPYRPAFSTTALGKVMTRFQTWAWNAVRFRKEVMKEAKLYGFRPGTREFDRFKRQYLSDMFVFGLGNVFAYSIFESAMPQPYSWFQDTADWIFGDENERDRAFFGAWPTAVAPLQVVTPPGLRMVPATFNAIVNNDFSRVADYHMWTMFPFGRMARDIKGVIENPMRAIEKGTGIPYMQFAREATKYREKDET